MRTVFNPRQRKFVRWVVGTVLASALIITLAYRDTVDIDLNSGQLRQRATVFTVPVKSSLQETDFSVLVDPASDRGQNWQRVHTFTLWNPTVSPHHRYEMTPWILTEFNLICGMYAVPMKEQREHASKLREILSTAEPAAVEKYVRRVHEQYYY